MAQFLVRAIPASNATVDYFYKSYINAFEAYEAAASNDELEVGTKIMLIDYNTGEILFDFIAEEMPASNSVDEVELDDLLDAYWAVLERDLTNDIELFF